MMGGEAMHIVYRTPTPAGMWRAARTTIPRRPGPGNTQLMALGAHLHSCVQGGGEGRGQQYSHTMAQPLIPGIPPQPPTPAEASRLCDSRVIQQAKLRPQS